MFEFEPSQKIRQFQCSDIIGKMATITCCHLSDDKKSQYVKAELQEFHELEIYSVSDWVSTIGPEKKKLKKKIIDAYLLEAQNGGRNDCQRYKSYWNYFNKEKKQEVVQYWRGGLLGRISRGGGDPDRVSLVLVFKEFRVEDNTWSLKAPEEWYSESLLKDNKFKFERGFYESSEEAIKFFADKPHDDLFGERYFPVIVFPKEVKEDVRSIAHMPKACSKPIQTKKHIVFGTRCKSYEYSELINKTYEVGGKVARSIEWDWE
jgi:hypothetical protein